VICFLFRYVLNRAVDLDHFETYSEFTILLSVARLFKVTFEHRYYRNENCKSTDGLEGIFSRTMKDDCFICQNCDHRARRYWVLLWAASSEFGFDAVRVS
jgi:hypothetical protein